MIERRLREYHRASIREIEADKVKFSFAGEELIFEIRRGYVIDQYRRRLRREFRYGTENVDAYFTKIDGGCKLIDVIRSEWKSRVKSDYVERRRAFFY